MVSRKMYPLSSITEVCLIYTKPCWFFEKCMPYYGVCPIVGMPYEGVNCNNNYAALSIRSNPNRIPWSLSNNCRPPDVMHHVSSLTLTMFLFSTIHLLLSLGAAWNLIQADARQIPLKNNFSASKNESWDLFNKPGNQDSTSHLIFNTANSFLQRWPNTRYRNG